MVRLMICLSALLLGGGADLLSARGRELVAGSYNIRCDTPVDGRQRVALPQGKGSRR